MRLERRVDGSFKSQGHNGELDAFRHAYTSGRVTQLAAGQQWIARRFGNEAEIGPAHPNDPYEHRMDLWNNEVRRRLGDEASGANALARKTYAALRSGELVTDLGDARLRQIFCDYPRLARPHGDPQRDLVTSSDVDRMNRDISRLQDQARDRFPIHHQDRAYFDTLRSKLPDTVSDTKVAEAPLTAKQAGIDNAGQLGSVTLCDDQIFVSGTTPGFRAQVDANAAAPDVRESVYQTNQHNVVQAYEQNTQAQPVNVGGH